MERNYPQMFSPADDQGKDGFKLENFWLTFSSFGFLSVLVQPFVLQSLLIFL